MIRKIKVFFVMISAIFIGGVFTSAYFSDSVSTTNNTFTAGVWSVTPSATPSSSPTAASILISEVYYDPNIAHGGVDAEWIELYNADSVPIDLDGWILWDNSTSETISGTNILPVGGRAVIATDASVFSNWSIPASAIRIVVGGSSLFNGLNNGGDRVVVFTPLSVEVDKVSWGSDTYAYSPSSVDVDPGHSLERSLVTTDTDTKDDFADQTNPNPGV